MFCLVITLPGPNTYDKLGYFVFVPAAILGGIALTELWLERRGASRRRMAAWVVAFMLPANALAFAGAFHTPGREIQRHLATKEPTPEQLEVGVAALAEILRAEGA